MNKILTHSFVINQNWSGHYTLLFRNYTTNVFQHIDACVDIADKLNIPIDNDKIYWNILLLNFGFPERHLHYRGYFPEFNSKHNLESFIILLNSHLLITVLPE